MVATLAEELQDQALVLADRRELLEEIPALHKPSL
jgi:hypothetical protein